MSYQQENLQDLKEKVPSQAGPRIELKRYDDTKLDYMGVIYLHSENITRLSGYSESEACPWGFAHNGIDFHFVNGSKVIAAAPGQVVYIRSRDYGPGVENRFTIDIKIKFNDSIIITYCFEPWTQNEADIDHQLTLFKVQEGDWVDKGDEIATFLNIREDSAHIHFQVSENHIAQCPVKYLSTEAYEELLDLLHSNPYTADWELHYHDYYNIPFEPEPVFPNENLIWDVPQWRILAYKSYFEGEEIPAEYKELLRALAPIKYYRITDAPLLTQYIDNYYCVQLQELYYDPLGIKNHKLIPIENRPKLNVSVINFTDPIVDAYSSMSPILLSEIPSKENNNLLLNLFIPKNGTELMLDWSAEQLNLTYSRSQIFTSQEVTELEIDFETNEIFINDTSSDAYVRLKYDDRGILYSGEIYFRCTGIFHGDNEWMLINTTRIFDDLDPFDDIEWAYDVDNRNTFNLIFNDVSNGNEAKLEVKLTAISSIYINFTSEDWGWYLKKIPIQVVQANISIPNVGTAQNIVIGSASEYVPQVIWEEIEEEYNYISDNIHLPLFFLNSKEFNSMYMGMLREMVTNDFIVEYGTNWFKFLDSKGNYSIFKYFADGTLHYIYSANDTMIFGRIHEGKPILFYLEDNVVNLTELTNELDVNEIKFEPTGLDDMDITLNVLVSANTTLIYSGFTKQPVQLSIDDALFYIDLGINDTVNLNFPINITIEYDDINLWWVKDVKLWRFDESGNNGKGKWELINNFIDFGNGKLNGSLFHVGIFAITLNSDIIWDFRAGDPLELWVDEHMNNTLIRSFGIIFKIKDMNYECVDGFNNYFVVKLEFIRATIDLGFTKYSLLYSTIINFNDGIMNPGGIRYINLFIPINDSGLALDWCANALNSYYSSLMNTNALTFKVIENGILFNDIGSNNFVDLRYRENGMLISGEFFMENYYYEGVGSGTYCMTIRNMSPF